MTNPTEQPRKQLLVDAEVAQNILNYLASRPYKETFNLIPGLLNLQEGQVLATQTQAPTATVDSESSVSQR